MKLKAKARPVQINRLRLGGKDIKSIQDLKNNFYVNEIISLDSKFTQWLDRNEDLKDLSSELKISLKNSNSTSDKAICLISSFFPEYKGQCVDTIIRDWLRDWQEKKTTINLVSSLLSCLNPTCQMLEEILGCQEWSDDPCIWDWIKKYVEQSEALSPSICLEYAKCLKRRNDNNSKDWLQKAADLGSKDAAELLAHEAAEFTIDIGSSRPLTMLRVNDPKGPFYISQNVVSLNDFYSLLGRNMVSEKFDACQQYAICENFINKLFWNTHYKFNFPTVQQWKSAKKNVVFDPAPTRYGERDGEWCKDKYNIGQHKVVDYKEISLSDFDYSYLRPVINISENSEMQ